MNWTVTGKKLACMQRLAKNMPTGRLTKCVAQLIHHRIFYPLETD